MTSSQLLHRLAAMLVLSLALGFAGAGSARGQEGSCKADVAKFCPSARPGGGQIARCLRQHKDELSPACQQRITTMAQELRAVVQACEDDVHNYCGGVQPGDGRIGACLRQNQDKLSTACKAKLADARQKR